MLASLGVEKAARENASITSAVNVYRGSLTCRAVAEAFGMPMQSQSPMPIS